VTYDGKRAADMPPSRYAVRHLVAEQVDAKLEQLHTDYIEKGTRGKHQLAGGMSKRAREDEDNLVSSPNKKAKIGAIDIADRVRVYPFS